MKVAVRWEGMASLKADLDSLSRNMQGSVIRTGLQSAAKVVVTAAKATVPSKRLKKIIAYTAWYKGPVAYASVGGKKGSKHIRLMHLIEQGTRPHKVNHPGTAARPFLRPAVEGNQADIQRKFLTAVRGRLDRIALKILRRKGG